MTPAILKKHVQQNVIHATYCLMLWEPALCECVCVHAPVCVYRCSGSLTLRQPKFPAAEQSWEKQRSRQKGELKTERNIELRPNGLQ